MSSGQTADRSSHEFPDAKGVAPATDLTDLYTQLTGEEPEKLLPAYSNKTLELIKEAQAARAARGEFGGLTLGSSRFHQLNVNWGGIDKGVHIIGGDTNMGKSSLLRMMAWDIIQNNPKAHVRFYTLDDSEEYFFDSFVAQAAKVPINAVNKPDGFVNKPDTYYSKADYEQMVERGHQMYEKFMRGDYLHNFSFAGTSSLGAADWTTIRNDIRIVKGQLPTGMQLVVIIDNFHDIDISDGHSDGDTNGKTERVANEVHKLAEQEDLIILGTAELKKNSQRRPILDDIYGSRKWKYKARSVLLIYSEVGAGKHNPRLFYERQDKPTEQSSVLEVHFAKAKGDSFKGRLFYHQITEMGLMVEVPLEQAKQYAMLIGS